MATKTHLDAPEAPLAQAVVALDVAWHEFT